jgi:hypothetical protein
MNRGCFYSTTLAGMAVLVTLAVSKKVGLSLNVRILLATLTLFVTPLVEIAVLFLIDAVLPGRYKKKP